MRSLAPLGVLGLIVFAAAGADAATVTGTVTGPDGAPFRAAFVQARHAGLKMTVSVLTDSQGNPATNMSLSEARAFAVKSWLEKQSPVNFPKGRIRIYAHGQQNPLAPNGTPQGRAQNRRVEVVLGTTGGAG